MSLYLGKSSNGNNILHLTSNAVNKETLANGLILDNTVFHSSYPITTVIYNTVVTVPGFSNRYEIGYQQLPSVANSYLSIPTNYVFILIEGLDGVYRDCGSSGVFIMLAGSSYHIANTNNSLAGKRALIIITNTYTYPSGSIFISKNQINIGGISLTSKKLLSINNNGTYPYKVSYPIENGNRLSLIDWDNVVSVALDNKSITYTDLSSKFEAVSEIGSNRIHTHTVGTVYGSIEVGASIYDGEAIVAVLPASIQSNGRRFLNVTIPMSYYYAEGWSGAGTNWDGLLRLSGYTDKSFIIDAQFFPFLRCRFEYSSITRVIKARLYRQTDQVESYYTGVLNPSIVYYTL